MAVYVPDEEAAAAIDAFALALRAGGAADLWPGFDAPRAAVGLALPGGGGIVLHGLRPAGAQAVVGRDGRTRPDLVRVAGGTELRRVEGAHNDPEVVEARLEGRWVPVALSVGRGGVARLAEASYAAAFRLHKAMSPAPGGVAADAGPAQRPDALAEAAALRTLEGRILLEALGWAAPSDDTGAPGPTDLRRLAHALALVRRERRAPMDDDGVGAETADEWALGLPAFVGWRAARAAGAQTPYAVDGGAMGELGAVSHVAACAASGLGLLALTEALGRPQDKLRRPGPHDLGRRLEEGVPFDGGPRDDALLAEALRRHGYADLVAEARRKAREAHDAREALIAEILQGEGTLLVVDVSALGAAVASPSAPQRVNAGVVVYPDGGTFRFSGGARVAAEGPVVVDQRSALLQTRLPARLRWQGDGSDAPADAGMAFDEGLDMSARGLSVHATAGEIVPIDGGYMLRLLR